MESIVNIILSIEALLFGGVLLTIVYLIVRRLDIRDQEKFEKRDN